MSGVFNCYVKGSSTSKVESDITLGNTNLCIYITLFDLSGFCRVAVKALALARFYAA
jgi:hypothetical protein